MVGFLDPRRFVVTYRELACREANAAAVVEYIIQYGRPGAPVEAKVAPNSPVVIENPLFQSFLNYQFQLAATNSEGMGLFGVPMEAAILSGESGFISLVTLRQGSLFPPLGTGPGKVSSLAVSPDVASITVRWDPPTEGRAFVTGYEITHMLFIPDANPIRQTLVNASTSSHRIVDLLPETFYQIFIWGLVDGMRGESTRVTQSTDAIGGL